MATKPFKSDSDKKMESLLSAADHIFQAISCLEDAKSSADNWAEYSSIADFKRNLDDFMSCDDGEAGLAIYVLFTSKEHFLEQMPINELMKMIAQAKKNK